MYWRLCYNRYCDDISSSLYIMIKEKYPHSDTDVSYNITAERIGPDWRPKMQDFDRWPVASHYHVNIHIS